MKTSIPANTAAAQSPTVAFNMLDATVFPHHDLMTGHDRAEVRALCRSLASLVESVADTGTTIFAKERWLVWERFAIQLPYPGS